jgi:hypothetical protein
MDGEHRPSSLPRSLIPHLFSGPQQPRYSHTRTTLQTQDLPPTSLREPTSFDPPLETRDRLLERRLPDPLHPPTSLQPYGNPIYREPALHSATHTPMSTSRLETYRLRPLSNPDNRHIFQPPDSWREGEAGPSSLLRPVSHDEGSFGRRRRASNRSEVQMNRSPGVGPRQEQMRHRGERDTYFPSSGRSWPGVFTLNHDIKIFIKHVGDYHSSSERLPGPAPLLDRSPGNQSPLYGQLHERQESYSFPAVGSLSISAPTPSYARGRSSERSEARSIEVGSNDGEGSQRGKRRRAESVETDDNAKKSRNSRKTAVACNFCRGGSIHRRGDLMLMIPIRAETTMQRREAGVLQLHGTEVRVRVRARAATTGPGEGAKGESEAGRGADGQQGGW